MGKFLALDYGTRRIGVASGVDGIAFPRCVFDNKGHDSNVSTVSDLVDELGVSTVVVGLPLSMDESMPENAHMSDVKIFFSKLKESLGGVNVVFFDERLSSFEAAGLIEDLRLIGDSGELGKDAFEAQIILQRFFDKNSS